MKIALLSGAVKNAGDYLITDRCSQVLQAVYPDAEISRYIRNHPLPQEQLEEVNDADCVIIGGGPCYKRNLYPDSIPFVSDLKLVKPKIFMMGCGWYGAVTSPAEIWNYKFSSSSMEFLNRVVSDSGVLGCRDYYAVRVLQANGFRNSLMTGCPAWYDLGKLGARLPAKTEIHSIAVSDPADVVHYGAQSLAICRYLKGRYPDAQLHYVFHRGTKADQYTGQKKATAAEELSVRLRDEGITVHDIAYGSAGFSLYDGCDLHVGHRVHAHIYNLSQRKRSILIEEDSRGAGVNEPLGLWSIKAYHRKKTGASPLLVKAYSKVFGYPLPNPYVVDDLQAYLNCLENTDFRLMNQAFSQMEAYYENMLAYTLNIRKKLEEA